MKTRHLTDRESKAVEIACHLNKCTSLTTPAQRESGVSEMIWHTWDGDIRTIQFGAAAVLIIEDLPENQRAE